MTVDPLGDPWSGTTYKGFAGTGPASPGPGEVRRHDDGLRIERLGPARLEPREPRRGVTRGVLLGGVAVALALGVLFGLVARPDLDDGGRTAEPMRAVTSAADGPAPAAAMPIEVAPEAAEPPQSADRLEVLPPELTRATAPVAGREAPPLRDRLRDRPEPAPAVALPTPAPAVERAPPPAPVPARPRIALAPAEPAFNCRYARSLAERLVCADPGLALLDRRMDRAFQRAMAAGVPFGLLRAEQDDWLAIREDAARHSPAAVASVYRQRIEELDAMAEEPLG